MIPLPGEVHPALTHLNFHHLKDLASKTNSRTVRVPHISRRAMKQMFHAGEFDPTADVRFNDVMLQLKTYRAPAPFVGVPFYYEWEAFDDGLNRYIADVSWVRYSSIGYCYRYGYPVLPDAYQHSIKQYPRSAFYENSRDSGLA